jgi:hypothetical protein
VVTDGTASRRGLLQAGGAAAAAGTAILLDACGGSDSTGSVLHKLGASARSLDVQILNRGLDLEYRSVAAYTAGIPLLSGDAARAAEQFLGQELSHAGELFGLVKEAKGKPHDQAQNYPIGHPRTAAEVLALLHELELAQISFYLDAIPKLAPGPVRAAVASVLANDAQHLALVRAAMRQAPLASPFVTGQG